MTCEPLPILEMPIVLPRKSAMDWTSDLAPTITAQSSGLVTSVCNHNALPQRAVRASWELHDGHAHWPTSRYSSGAALFLTTPAMSDSVSATATSMSLSLIALMSCPVPPGDTGAGPSQRRAQKSVTGSGEDDALGHETSSMLFSALAAYCSNGDEKCSGT